MTGRAGAGELAVVQRHGAVRVRQRERVLGGFGQHGRSRAEPHPLLDGPFELVGRDGAPDQVASGRIARTRQIAEVHPVAPIGQLRHRGAARRASGRRAEFGGFGGNPKTGLNGEGQAIRAHGGLDAVAVDVKEPPAAARNGDHPGHAGPVRESLPCLGDERNPLRRQRHGTDDAAALREHVQPHAAILEEDRGGVGHRQAGRHTEIRWSEQRADDCAGASG